MYGCRLHSLHLYITLEAGNCQAYFSWTKVIEQRNNKGRKIKSLKEIHRVVALCNCRRVVVLHYIVRSIKITLNIYLKSMLNGMLMTNCLTGIFFKNTWTIFILKCIIIKTALNRFVLSNTKAWSTNELHNPHYV